MEHLISACVSGFASVLGKIFGSPLDFLQGKSCNSVCRETWDFICYIENFCVSHLLKSASVAVLFYFVLLFFYLLYKLRICKCIIKVLCKMVWAIIRTWFSVWEYGCYFLCHKLRGVKRTHRRRKRDIEAFDTSCSGGDEEEEQEEGDSISSSRIEKRSRDYKGDHLRRSLRPRSHRIQIGIGGNSGNFTKKNVGKHLDNEASTIHDIRVARTSKFARKGANRSKGSIRRRRR